MRISTIALCLGFGLASLLFAGPAARAADPTTQTIVLMRHGEKPAAGLGQLDCQGLNRALALPPVLARRFGRPAAIFAPNPAQRVEDDGHAYNYIRPLATIEPTAIALGMPVDTSVGFTDTEGLQRRLGEPHLHNALVFVAWEHVRIVEIARSLMGKHGGAAAAVPGWSESDFDSIYIVTILRTAEGVRARFEHAHEGLNGQSKACPG